MNISTLCDKIELQSYIRNRVLSFVENIDFQIIDKYQNDYYEYKKMKEARLHVREILGEDVDGIKILACMLKACVDSYGVYQAKGIPDDIYFSTMRCFTRFIDETYKMTGDLCFDRYWWTTRQVGCHLFRIGELEYEIKPIDKNTIIDIHIPSDANFPPFLVEKSLKDAQIFFEKYFPLLSNAEYHCHSWLLDGQLRSMLSNSSNIINFQNRFEILNEGEVDTEFIEWLFNTKSLDYTTLPENTSLQRNVKNHLLTGGVIRTPYGRIKEVL